MQIFMTIILFIFAEQKLAKLREEINGEKLTIVTYDDYPLSYMETINGTRQPMGVSFQLLSLLTVKLNFTYDLIFPENNIYGSSNDMKGSLIEVLNTSVSAAVCREKLL